MKLKRLNIILTAIVFLLFIPLIAMQFTNSIDWDIPDFLIAGLLLLGTGLCYELVIRQVKSIKNRIIIGAFILLLLFLTWAELAVGIFGTPFAGS